MLQLGSCRKAIWKANSIESPTGEKYVTRICADTTPNDTEEREEEERQKDDTMEVLIDGLQVLKFKNKVRQYECYVPSAPISTPLTTMTIKASSKKEGGAVHMALTQITIYFSDDGNVDITDFLPGPACLVCV